MTRVGGRWTGRFLVVGLVIAFITTALPAPAEAAHSWKGYHWAREGDPVLVPLGDNVSSAWDSYLVQADADWTADGGYPDVLDTTIVAGASNPKQCAPAAGRVEVCNYRYGQTGWLGVATVWATEGHITQATVKLNDTYFAMKAYNTPGWRTLVTCQEVGHTFGLHHQDENQTNANLGSCMDYTTDPDGTKADQLSNEHPNAHDYEQLNSSHDHTDSSSTLTSSTAQTAGRSGQELPDPAGPERGGVSVFETDLGQGNRALQFVIWADANVIGAAHADANAPIADPATDQESFPVDGETHDHEDGEDHDTDADGLTDADETAVYGTDLGAFDTDGDGAGDGDEVVAGTDPLTADGAAAALDANTGFAVGTSVVTNDAVNLRAAASRQAEVVTELAAGTTLTVTGAAEEGQGLVWVPVATSDGTLAGYVAADFLTLA